MESLDNQQVNTDYLEEDEFRLPVGFIDSEGRFINTIKLRPMTGETDEAIASPKVRDNGGKLVTELIYSVTERLGNSEKVNKDQIRQLSSVDRDYILLKNRQVSMGEDFTYVDKCPHCGGSNQVSVNIPSVPVTYLDKDAPRTVTFELKDGVLAEGTVHKTITIQIPNGYVQERIAPMARTNPAQATTSMLAMITKDIVGVKYIDANVFRKMTKRDRNLIQKKLEELGNCLELATTITCASCGAEYKSYFPITSLMGE